MKKPATHVKILGVEIPLATLRFATSTVPYGYTSYIFGTEAMFNKWWPDDLKDLFKAPSVFEKLASRRDGRIPCKAGVSHQFFQYDILSEKAT